MERTENSQNVTPENGTAGFPTETFVMPFGVDMMDFCAKNHDLLEEPFSDGGYTFFSNGHCAVRILSIDSVVRKPPFESLLKIKWEPPAGGAWSSIPTVKVEMKTCGSCLGSGATTQCNECDGEGELMFDTDNYTYEVECKECFGDGVTAGGHDTCSICDGKGELPKDRHMNTRVGGILFSLVLLNLIQKLPDVEIYNKPVNGNGCMFLFRFDGGDGVLMKMLD